MSDTVQQFASQPSTPNQQAKDTEATEPTSGRIKPPERPAPKTIVVCCDGTGNEFAGKDATNNNSNVVKLYTALDLDFTQIAYYHPGVGTMGDPTKKGAARLWSMVKGLAFGWGFEENVLDAYRYLMQHYNSGDTVFLFGFSRGAYTARALAGLLHGYGLLCRGNEGHIPYAWRMYNQKVQDQGQQNRRTIETDFSFRDTFCHPSFILHFVGLWDTVSSVGWITTPLRLLHLAQNATIVNGRHAVSIDERRCFYQDNLWGEAGPVQLPPALVGTEEAEHIPSKQDILQVWFSGVHSDVGGSYPQLESKLSNITLEWMLNEAEKFGLRFAKGQNDSKGNVIADRRKLVLGGTITTADDPKGELTSLTPLYESPRKSKLHNSLSWPWWILEVFPHGYYASDDSKEKMRIPLGSWRSIPRGAHVHPSVRERIVNKVCYRPSNVTAGELKALSKTDKEYGNYYTFEPLECRKGGWRQNWLVVFLVTVAELAFGFTALIHALLWIAKILNYCVHLIAWLAERIFTAPDLSWLWPALRAWSKFVKDAQGFEGHWVLYYSMPLLIATSFVIIRSIMGAAKRARS